MGRRLAETIVLRHPSTGEPVVLEAGTIPPAWAAERISNPDVWAPGPDVGEEPTTGQPATNHNDPADDEPADELTEGPPPDRPAANGPKATWVAYAESLGLDVPDAATRADIIALVDAHLALELALEAPGA